MGEAYSSGVSTVKEGSGDAFSEAWTELARWLSTMPGAGFTPSGFELVAEVSP